MLPSDTPNTAHFFLPSHYRLSTKGLRRSHACGSHAAADRHTVLLKPPSAKAKSETRGTTESRYGSGLRQMDASATGRSIAFFVRTSRSNPSAVCQSIAPPFFSRTTRKQEG